MAHKKKDNPNDLMSLRQEIGRHWENKVFDLLRTLGYDVEWYANENWNSEFDLSINGKPIEVKAAYQSRQSNGTGTNRSRWLFNLVSKEKVETPYFVILVAIDENDLETYFFIPGNKVTGKTVSLTSHPMSYTGKYSKYRSDTDYLDTFVYS